MARRHDDVSEHGDLGTGNMVAVSKYDPLLQYLSKSDQSVLTLSFADIERILGDALPPSARQHQAWWANETVGTHPHANAWMDAGFAIEDADLNAGKVTFRRCG
ncbi:MAG: hypothetical protein QF575_08650 [Acidimicrobiales bacterium]|nr:hypothetical protein [Acidimicrobiales bacterium]